MTNRRASDLFGDHSDDRPPASSIVDPRKMVREGQAFEKLQRESIEKLGRGDDQAPPSLHQRPE